MSIVQCKYRGESDEADQQGLILGFSTVGGERVGAVQTELQTVALVAIPSGRIVPIALDRIKVDVQVR